MAVELGEGTPEVQLEQLYAQGNARIAAAHQRKLAAATTPAEQEEEMHRHYHRSQMMELLVLLYQDANGAKALTSEQKNTILTSVLLHEIESM